MLRIRGEPAGQIEFESNRLAIYTTQANIFWSFLRQAKNLIAIRYKRQALHNNKITKVRLVCYKLSHAHGTASRLHARVRVRTYLYSK